VLFGVRGLKDYWTIGSGTIQIADDGKNNWVAGGTTRKYLIAKKPVPDVKKIIEDMMVAPPRSGAQLR